MPTTSTICAAIPRSCRRWYCCSTPTSTSAASCRLRSQPKPPVSVVPRLKQHALDVKPALEPGVRGHLRRLSAASASAGSRHPCCAGVEGHGMVRGQCRRLHLRRPRSKPCRPTSRPRRTRCAPTTRSLASLLRSATPRPAMKRVLDLRARRLRRRRRSASTSVSSSPTSVQHGVRHATRCVSCFTRPPG